MTGNDIISRSLIQSQSRPLRYAQKILNLAELEQVKQSDEFISIIYAYWACKEAAYKIDRKKGQSRKLNPKEYFVEFGRQKVRVISSVMNFIYSGKVEMKTNYLHATLWELEDKPSSRVVPIISSKRSDRSLPLYQNISITLTNGKHLVSKNSDNIPSLLGWDISLSHCGHWGAWSAVKV
jgi:phosphopantetheinyl transferase (holo-ACP synthase)